ncbi:hypothetical protein PF005_g30908 [Phytophthora fragariae]|uniref:Uncharacterized protein n=1 Tax=Phytophthora fragariae TaxID=53985 RepID=A0A6A3DJ31_9STRA|nr:hypothetical protein PF009_g31195 [Phytophthora fragariae]KAE9162296.1 hypothetical protein PF005_g30908 [Phytophthora fragariae]
MAALKYVCEAQEEVGSREVLRLVEEGDERVEWKAAVPTEEGERHASAEEVRLFEEGGVAVKDAGGSVVAVVANTGAMADEGSDLKGTSGTAVMELGGHLVPRVTDVAKVRMTRKAARREAKDRRIERAKNDEDERRPRRPTKSWSSAEQVDGTNCRRSPDAKANVLA